MREKIVVVRPGALGDVIATRSLLNCARAAFPDACIALAAPGERGDFLARHGLADEFFDWESRDFSWLFTDSAENPPKRLEVFLGDATLALAFIGRPGGDFASLFQRRLHLLAPKATITVAEAVPPATVDCSVYAWLCRPFLTYIGKEDTAVPCRGSGRVRIDARGEPGKRYAVIHPGSGGKTKNWPVENYARVADFLCGIKTPGENVPYFSTLYVTEGEADAGLGERLCHAVSGARLVSMPSLDDLAALLANAAVYIGNDSGVSHLAGAVENAQGGCPDIITIFGPSNSRIWRPPAAHVIEAGGAIDSLGPDAVFDLLSRLVAEKQMGESDVN